MKNLKNKFQDIHYSRQKASFCLGCVLGLGEFFYSKIIKIKNFLYEINFLKEFDTKANVICVGNLTTGGVGKTPIVINLANELSKKEKVAIISRGYGAKLQNKTPNVIKDFNEIKFPNGSLCGDEPYQLAKKVSNNTVVITCRNRKLAIQEAIIKFGCKTIILDDGFSNRKVKKTKTIVAIDSKMRFGNNHLLPYGPLREPISEIKRASEIILVNKGDENFNDALIWAKNNFNKPIKVCNMTPKRIYNLQTKANVLSREKTNAIAFCAIGQPKQFFDFAKQFYEIKKEIAFSDHHKYDKDDIKELIKIAKENNTNVFITTKKDETKLIELIKNVTNFSFNTLELDIEIKEVK